MNVASLQQEILKLKKEKDVCVLAHSYVAREICEIADFTGDSYKPARSSLPTSTYGSHSPSRDARWPIRWTER